MRHLFEQRKHFRGLNPDDAIAKLKKTKHFTQLIEDYPGLAKSCDVDGQTKSVVDATLRGYVKTVLDFDDDDEATYKGFDPIPVVDRKNNRVGYHSHAEGVTSYNTEYPSTRYALHRSSCF